MTRPTNMVLFIDWFLCADIVPCVNTGLFIFNLKVRNYMHERYMELVIADAFKGAGKTFTNPLVGRVIVKNQSIISTGYHMNYGVYHEEVNAIL